MRGKLLHAFKDKNYSASHERSHLYNHFYYSRNCTHFLLIYMFGPGRHQKNDSDQPKYKAGVYTSSIAFEGQTLDVQVVVDEDHINSVSFVNLNDTVATMYPLMQSPWTISVSRSAKRSPPTTFLIRKKINIPQRCS